MPQSFEINIEKIIRGKFPKAPKLVIRLVVRLIHLDFLNAFFQKGYTGVEFCHEALKFLNISLSVEGSIPHGGPYTFVSNHPLGGIDGIALLDLIGAQDRDVMLLGNDFLTAIKGLAPMIVPVSKVGMQSRNLKANIDRAFESEANMLVFPAGKVSRKTNGVIQDQKWAKTFLQKSIETKRDIVPIHFIGTNSRRFYRIGRMEKFFRLRFPLGMLFLPDEMVRANGRSYRVVIGQPISYKTFDSSRSVNDWTQYIRQTVYEL
jgi:putative hemolysin